jgi:hypothetical protein
MTLTIHKLTTRCRSPRGFERTGALADEVARGLLAIELGAQIGPSLDRLPGVTRLKQLRVRLKLSARKLNTATLADAWARALTVSLHQALASPAGDGAFCLRRYESDAAYTAAMLHHIAASGLDPCWEFPELEAWRGCSPAEAIVFVLLNSPRLIPEVAAHLHQRGWLERMLVFLDELSLERIMQAVALNDINPPDMTLESLIALGFAAAATGGLRPEWAFAGRRQAIRLWARLYPRFPLRAVWHGLRLLLKLLEIPALLILRDPALLVDPIPFPPWCQSIVSAGGLPSAASRRADSTSGVANGSSEHGLASSTLLSALNGLSVHAPATARPISAARSGTSMRSILEGLRPLVPSAVNPFSTDRNGVTTQWISSGCAGILLLLSTVQRLDLARFARKPEFIRFGGPRALSFLLAGIGMTLLKRWTPGELIDPAVALFAGIFAEPDLPGMKQFFLETSVHAVAGFVEAETWEDALEKSATELSRSFALSVRGFRNASREAVVKQFIRVRGRVLVEQARVLVVLEPNPWAVALHLSDMDDPLASVEWLQHRRVEFVQEGL